MLGLGATAGHQEERDEVGSASMADVMVIGAGVIGLAIARELALRGHAVVLVERHARHGEETSSRNSGVVHAGLYYPPGSLKAQCCVHGRERLERYCATRGIPQVRCGKLVVATDATELARLEALAERAEANGLRGLMLRDRRWLAREEPALGAVAALDVPMSGLVDVPELLRSLRAEAIGAGASLALASAVVGLDPRTSGWRVVLRDPDGETSAVEVEVLVNAAGHGASTLAALSGVDIDAPAPDGGSWRTLPWKGRYFVLGPGAPRPRRPLVYPLPVPGGLGTHLTRDLGGTWLLGPDASPADGLADLDVDPAAAPAFAASGARYLPELRSEMLRPGYAGLRPKRNRDGSFADFLLAPGLTNPGSMSIHLVGIESPGLTSCLELASRAADLLD